MDEFKKVGYQGHSRIGIGGYGCPCCNPFKSKERLRRISRRRLKEATMKETEKATEAE